MEKLNDFFSWSARERRGVMVLAAIMVFMAVLPRFYPVIYPEEIPVAIPLPPKELPGRYDDDSIKYHSSRFQRKKYGDLPGKRNDFARTAVRIPVSVEMNSADTAGFEKLPGIGKVLSRRIVKYRTLLGGFSGKEQLLEVYGISDSLFRALGNRVNIDTARLKRININEASFSQLDRHPYISPKLGNWIIRYREQHGPYKSVSDIRSSYLMDDSLYQKLEPYLSAE